MPQAQLVVFTNAVAGRDADFNAWYDGTHLDEVCAVPGITGARRSHAIDSAALPNAYRYLAIYEIDADDPAAVVGEIIRRFNGGEMTPTDSMSEDLMMSLYDRRADGA